MVALNNRTLLRLLSTVDLPNPENQTWVSHTAGGFFTSGATREAQEPGVNGHGSDNRALALELGPAHLKLCQRLVRNPD